MTRLEATQRIAAACGSDPVVASLGHPAYDLFATGDRDTYFYTWGSMGLASSIGLGLAMAKPDRRVVVLDGDGSLLMNLGSLATIGWVGPANLILIVIDNRLYGTTGGQESATAHGADLERAARALGVDRCITVKTLDDLGGALIRAWEYPGPWVIVADVEETAPTMRPPQDCVFIKQRFMRAIGSPEGATQGGPA
ncbi:MAG TPA: thiamine pyrophosphate-dependent enzyme [Vicinamibacterales bacterium]|nr:thiamine pyrophosphate-dependent enzyme [Vicinamibacterales bacterium]